MHEVEIDVLMSARAAMEQHRGECDRPPNVLLLNPGNYELLGWDELWGLPVLADTDVPPLRCKLVCGSDGRAGEFCGRPVIWRDAKPHHRIEADGEEEAA